MQYGMNKLKMEKNKISWPWKNSEEFYDMQAKDLFSHLDEVPFYHVAVIGNTPEEFIDYIINENNINEDSMVVDLGCGGGYVVNKLSNICEIEGVSNSKECIKQAKINYPNNKFLVENMETYSGRNKTHCLTLESLFYSNVENTFKNISKVLNKEGIFSIKEWCYTGNHDESMLESKEYWEDKENLIDCFLTVRYQEKSKDGIPRFPIGIDIRFDLSKQKLKKEDYKPSVPIYDTSFHRGW